MKRTNIINYLIQKNNFSTYLEIGVENESVNFDQIKCKYRFGVDPSGCTCFTGTSDEFFLMNNMMFDIIFIDGDHAEEQVTKDIENSLKVLNPNGIIVLHDCLPETEWQQTEKYNNSIWTGTVWRSLARLRMSRDDLQLDIVDTDWGCGILRHGPSKLFDVVPDELNFDFFLTYKYNMFNIISVEQFKEKYKNE